MKVAPRSFAVAVGLAILALIAGAGHASSTPKGVRDWPMWGGTTDRNMVAIAGRLPATFDPGIRGSIRAAPDVSASRNVLWIAPLGPRTYGSPIVADGKVLIGTTTGGLAHTWGPAPAGIGKSGGDLLCLDARTGRSIWHLPLPKLSSRISHHSDTGYGMCATGAIEGDRGYIVSNRGEVLCLDMAGMADGNDGPFTDERSLLQALTDRGETVPVARLPEDCGDVLWCYDMVKELAVHPHDASSSSVLIHGDFLYVCTGNGRNEREDRALSPLAPSLIALDKRTGKLVAQDAEEIGTRMWKSQWSSPALSVAGGKERITFGAGDGRCYAFEPVRRADPDRVLALKRLWSTDCNHPDYRRADFVIPKRPTRMPGPSEIVGTPVCDDERVYVTVGRDPAHLVGKGCLTCLDAETGRRVWTYAEIGPCLATVSVAEGLVYVGEIRRTFHCVDAADGTVRWTHEIRGEIWGSSLVADGKVYVPTSRGLLVFAAGREKKLLTTVKLDGPLYSTPCVADGVLFVASSRSLFAVADEEASRTEGPSGATAGVAALALEGALPGGRTLQFHLDLGKGVVARAIAVAPTYNRVPYDVDVSALSLQDGKLAGTVKVTIVSDGYVPKSGALTAVYRLAADVREGRVAGRFDGTVGQDPVAGEVSGARLPRPPQGPVHLSLQCENVIHTPEGLRPTDRRARLHFGVDAEGRAVAGRMDPPGSMTDTIFTTYLRRLAVRLRGGRLSGFWRAEVLHQGGGLFPYRYTIDGAVVGGLAAGTVDVRQGDRILPAGRFVGEVRRRLPAPGDANAVLVLHDVLGRGRFLRLYTVNRKDRFVHGFAASPRFNGATHEVDLEALEIDGPAVRGTVRILAHPDPWVPKDGRPIPCELRVDAKVREAELVGSYEGTAGGKTVEGALEGTLEPPARAPQPGRVFLKLEDALSGPNPTANRCFVKATVRDGGIRSGAVSNNHSDLAGTVKGGVTVYEDRFAARLRISVTEGGGAESGEYRVQAEGVCVGDVCAGHFETSRGKGQPVKRGRFRGSLEAEEELEDQPTPP